MNDTQWLLLGGGAAALAYWWFNRDTAPDTDAIPSGDSYAPSGGEAASGSNAAGTCGSPGPAGSYQRMAYTACKLRNRPAVSGLRGANLNGPAITFLGRYHPLRRYA